MSEMPPPTKEEFLDLAEKVQEIKDIQGTAIQEQRDIASKTARMYSCLIDSDDSVIVTMKLLAIKLDAAEKRLERMEGVHRKLAWMIITSVVAALLSLVVGITQSS